MKHAGAWVLVTAGLIAAAPAHSWGQSFRVGDRIRVKAPPGLPDPQPGQLSSLDPTSLTLQAGARDLGGAGAEWREWVIPLEVIAELEVSEGERGHPGLGAVIGGALGLVVALIGGGDPNECHVGGGECLLFYAGLPVGGGLVGGLVGAAVRTERWISVPLP
jgi:hypothetical protein